MRITYERATSSDIERLYLLCRQLIDDYENIECIDYERVLRWVRQKLETTIDEYTAVYAEGQKALFVTGLASEKQMEQVCGHLKAALPQTQIVCERNLVESASARRKLAEAEGVILVEERGNSKYSVIAQEIELAKNVNIDVIGVIVA